MDIGITGLDTNNINYNMDIIIDYLNKMGWIKKIKYLYKI